MVCIPYWVLIEAMLRQEIFKIDHGYTMEDGFPNHCLNRKMLKVSQVCLEMNPEQTTTYFASEKKTITLRSYLGLSLHFHHLLGLDKPGSAMRHEEFVVAHLETHVSSLRFEPKEMAGCQGDQFSHKINFHTWLQI